jgi:hypothetical protein
VRSSGGRLLGVTMYNGIVMEPQKTPAKMAVALNP